ncbi:MAG: calcium-binding protein, partial [Allomuricauda sp.]
LAAGCSNDSDDEQPIALEAGTLSGGPFTITVDGTPDMISGITLDDSNVVGSNRTYVITDDSRNILGLPPDLTALGGVDFDAAGVGICFVYHLVYEAGLTGLEPGMNLDNLSGDHDLSNAITVNRNGLNAGTLSGGPYTILVDGNPDMISGVSLDSSELTGTNQTYVITDDEQNILGLPPTIEALEGVNFDGAGVGVCFVYHLTYEDGLTGLEAGMNLDDFSGTYALSNSITVNRNGLNAGIIGGGPYTITVDGNPDMVSGITLDDSELTGSMQGWVITDDANNILGLPPTIEAVEGVDFDGAGVGTCFIWHITYEGGLTGLEEGREVAEWRAFYALYNYITVNRNGLNAGSIAGGPFTILVDGTPDMVSGITLDDSELTGSKQGWVITDDANNILGLPPTLEAVEGVDFDGAGVGTCLIWHITYEEGLTGLEAGMNVADLEGFYALSNSITVNRNGLNAGTLAGGPFTFDVDGTPDMVSGITLDDSELTGTNQTYVITDDANNILGLPPTLEAVEGVDFDAAGTGVCYIWHITYEDGLVGLEAGMNVADLDGFYALSNGISVTRN